MTREINYRQALNEALHQEMSLDPTVIVMGEEVAGGGERPGMMDVWGGVFGVTKGLIAKYGPARVLDTPISEMGFLGAAVGAAMTGLRPVVEIGFISFFGVCLDQLSNHASKIRYMSGGQVAIPLTVRTTTGAGACVGAQHSDSIYSILIHFPGIKCVMPSNPYDAKGLLISSIRDNNPVVFVENKMLYNDKGPVPEEDYVVPIGKGVVCREGKDVTIVAFSRMVKTSLQAAENLAREGVEAEVIDPRTACPLDEEIILESLKKTGRLIVVDEDTPLCSLAHDVAALAVERGFSWLKAPVKCVTPPNTPVPYSPRMEGFYMPNAAKIAAAVKEIL